MQARYGRDTPPRTAGIAPPASAYPVAYLDFAMAHMRALRGQSGQALASGRPGCTQLAFSCTAAAHSSGQGAAAAEVGHAAPSVEA